MQRRQRFASDAREIMFRPESIRILDAGGGSLRGVVASIDYLGDRTRLLVSGFGPQPLVVESSDEREFAVGEALSLTIRPNAIIALAKD